MDRGGLTVRNPEDACHVAVPCLDLDEVVDFYVAGLGCKLARRYADRITLDFFGDQLVCHLSDPSQIISPVSFYPRHFGVTFRHQLDFERLAKLIQIRKIPFLVAPTVRFEQLAEEHLTMAVVDPANNVIEFKHYRDPRMMY